VSPASDQYVIRGGQQKYERLTVLARGWWCGKPPRRRAYPNVEFRQMNIYELAEPTFVARLAPSRPGLAAPRSGPPRKKNAAPAD
jgi:hypothetical protein